MIKKRIQRSSPMHILLLADNSGSMVGQPARLVSAAVREWVASLLGLTRYDPEKTYFFFTLITFDNEVDVIAQAVNVHELNVDALLLTGKERATTDLGAALDKAYDVLNTTPTAAEHCPPFVFVFSDGRATDPEAARRAAERLKGLDLPCGKPHIVTMGFGDIDPDFMRAIASEPDFFVPINDINAIVALLPHVGTPSTIDGKATVDGFREQIRRAGADGNVG